MATIKPKRTHRSAWRAARAWRPARAARSRSGAAAILSWTTRFASGAAFARRNVPRL